MLYSNQSIKQSINQSSKQAINRSINQSIDVSAPWHLKYIQSINQPTAISRWVSSSVLKLSRVFIVFCTCRGIFVGYGWMGWVKVWLGCESSAPDQGYLYLEITSSWKKVEVPSTVLIPWKSRMGMKKFIIYRPRKCWWWSPTDWRRSPDVPVRDILLGSTWKCTFSGQRSAACRPMSKGRKQCNEKEFMPQTVEIRTWMKNNKEK